jgi:hypothetical protein
VKDGLPVKRWVLISGSLGLLASAVSYAILLNTDTMAHYKARSIAILIWPTGLFLMANEGATSPVEIAGNYAMAIGGNLVLYIAGGLLLYGMTVLVRRLRR